ncbi:MAG: hypothetical protein M4579_004926 [Chaenotheca gracillima]|nr:MAG: hypothetical protein M4579_004926 [Chaenotheca gracillima]
MGPTFKLPLEAELHHKTRLPRHLLFSELFSQLGIQLTSVAPLDRIRSWARNKAHAENYNPFAAGGERPALPLTEIPVKDPTNVEPKNTTRTSLPASATDPTRLPKHGGARVPTQSTARQVPDKTSTALPPPAPPPANRDGAGETPAPVEDEALKPNVAVRFYQTSKMILFSSWLNVLLVFVPVGIAVQAIGLNPNIVFAMNAIAIIPLAGLLSYATESVARKMGDTIGALMNVTFGNAVELIILIALAKDEIRIVQASLLGSILANLLLILGMCFLFGGLRYREQIYNSTVTQMSACLLSLSVMSLLLPTAFHASFTSSDAADVAVLKVSRGTSVVLLLVYVLYLLFQLKSHAYMYESTPQHIIDEESHPGLLADIMNSSSSSGSSSSSSSTSSDDSSGSHTTAKRIKRVMRRGRRRRKSSVSSKETPVLTPAARTGSASSNKNFLDSPRIVHGESPMERAFGHELGSIASGDEADTDVDGELHMRQREPNDRVVNFRDFEKGSPQKSPEPKTKSKKKHHKRKGSDGKDGKHSEKRSNTDESASSVAPTVAPQAPVDESGQHPEGWSQASRRPFNIRALSFRPAIPKTLSSAIMTPARGSPSLRPAVPASEVEPKSNLRRTNSLPDRLNKEATPAATPATVSQPLPYIMPVNVSRLSLDSKDEDNNKKHISRTTAIVLLCVSTGLVALCAYYLVDSINYMVLHSGVSQAFVGLIILAIVGNAAEHVTAVTVASKNKMDLAIGVAVGSSIQIALFVTPVVVLLGWIMGKDMTLYFTLFETISLFVSAFIVNFLVLDGRSNYLEGALLVAAYIIIALAAFFYPDSTQESTIGGSPGV